MAHHPLVFYMCCQAGIHAISQQAARDVATLRGSLQLTVDALAQTEQLHQRSQVCLFASDLVMLNFNRTLKCQVERMRCCELS